MYTVLWACPRKPVTVGNQEDLYNMFRDVGLQPNHHDPLGPGNGQYLGLVILTACNLNYQSSSMVTGIH